MIVPNLPAGEEEEEKERVDAEAASSEVRVCVCVCLWLDMRACMRLSLLPTHAQPESCVSVLYLLLYFWPRQNQRMARARRRCAGFRKFP